MNALNAPLHKRIANRLVFYAVTLLVIWLVGNTQSSQTEIESRRDQRLGVAKAYFASPIDPRPIRATEKP